VKHQSRIAVFAGWLHPLPLLLKGRSFVAPLLFDSPATSQLGGPWALRPRLTTGLPFSLAHTRMRCLTPALLAESNESAMNFEGLGVSFLTDLCFSAAIPSVGT